MLKSCFGHLHSQFVLMCSSADFSSGQARIRQWCASKLYIQVLSQWYIRVDMGGTGRDVARGFHRKIPRPRLPSLGPFFPIKGFG